MYDAYQERIIECDRALEQHLEGLADKVADTAPDAASSPAAFAQSTALESQAAPESGQPRAAI